MSGRHFRAISAASLAASIAGCATLGGNVKGDFDCRAPEGSCAPTTLIDSAAIGEAGTGMASRAATSQPDPQNAPVFNPLPLQLPLQLPEVLVIPSQAPEAQPGVSAPVTGAPGRLPSPGWVPHPLSPGEPEGESQ